MARICEQDYGHLSVTPPWGSNTNNYKKLNINEDLYNFEALSKSSLLKLVENDIKTLDELAELDSEELFNILGTSVFINEDDAGSVIMKAREHWFQEEITEKTIGLAETVDIIDGTNNNPFAAYRKLDSERKFGRETWQILLAVVLGLLLVEVILLRKFGRVARL